MNTMIISTKSFANAVISYDEYFSDMHKYDDYAKTFLEEGVKLIPKKNVDYEYFNKTHLVEFYV